MPSNDIHSHDEPALEDLIDWSAVRQLDLPVHLQTCDASIISQRIARRRRQRMLIKGVVTCSILLVCFGASVWISGNLAEGPPGAERAPGAVQIVKETSVTSALELQLVAFNQRLDQFEQNLLDQELMNQRSLCSATQEKYERTNLHRVCQQGIVMRRLAPPKFDQ